MQPMKKIAPLKRVAAAPVKVKTRASGNEYFGTSVMLIVEPLEKISPFAIFVNLIQSPYFCVGRPLFSENPLPVFVNIPVEVGIGRNNMPGQSGLAHLPGTGKKNHLLGKILPDLIFVVPCAIRKII
jgi:hypothetical protein